MRRQRPEAADYNEYYRKYVELVADGDIAVTLAHQWEETEALLSSVPTEKEQYRYAPGKWSMREVVGHLIDVERLFAFRSLWIARAAEGEQWGMEQDEWVTISKADARSLADLTADWGTLRASNVQLFRSYDEEAWARVGVASGFNVSVRALPWMMAGHELHHRGLLARDYLGDGR